MKKRNQNKPKILVIVGPTASGKSDLGIKLARKFSGEIISADSRQVYKGMDIGTGKVRQDRTFPVPNSKLKTQNLKLNKNEFYSDGIRHYLLDVASPKKTFSVDRYKKLGEKAIKEISAKGKIPIIVGGTGFYVDVLLGRMSFAEVPPNKKLRAELEKQSVEQLFKQLKLLDPERAKTIDSKNKRRLIRALEIILSAGKPVPQISDFYHDRGKNTMSLNYNILWLGVKWPQKELEKRIMLRLDQRLDEEMIKEVQNLLKSGVSYRRLFDFGLEYRQIAEYLKTNISKPKSQSVKEFKKSPYYEKLLREIIKYSKRQMTWFKRNPEIHWFTPSSTEELNPKSKNLVRQAEIISKKFLFS